ncbi:MAG: hypothetical protein H7Z42_09665, partial [Roseiflexaceae bacterium]|nr:hypothetical protein [Roseiflexaceae bacterium]
RNQVIGAISCVLTNAQRSYDQSDLELFEELARRCAQAVDNARLFQAAQAAVRVRDAFLSVAAHELKTPLTTLYGQAQLLQRRLHQGGVVEERDVQAISRVVGQARRLNRMIGDLLDLSRIEAGQLTIMRERLDVNALVAQVVEIAQPILAPQAIEVALLDAPLYAAVDAIRFEQVLHNLLSNAVKYSPGGQRVLVSVERQNGSVAIAVRDFGIGVPADAMAHLFDRFYRAPNAEQQRISGIGVGLYVVREIITLHGGTIDVASVEGQGSVFTVKLPVGE